MAATSLTRHWSRPWCEGRGGMGSHHLLLRSSNASEGGGGAGAGDAYNFHLAIPPPPEPEWATQRTPEGHGVIVTISGHRRRGLALRLIRTKPKTTRGVVLSAQRKAWGQLSARATKTIQTTHRGPCNRGN